MSTNMTASQNHELRRLLELSAMIGSDPLLTQASTGNSSIKVNDMLWIKASGKWMADAFRDEFLVPLDLAEVKACVRQHIDPTELHTSASLETAMHAVLPQRVVLHVHCVNTIAWAVRQDARNQLRHKLEGLRWQWIPYVASGLALASAVERALSVSPHTDLLVLGNHGLVIGGEDCRAVEDLLWEVGRRLAIPARPAHPADYAVLADIADRWSWDLPDDDNVHALGTDPVSRSILSGGLLYPCQAIFSNASSAELFRSIPSAEPGGREENLFRSRPFLIVQERGVIFSAAMTSAERSMINGLAQVIQRIGANAPVRYLSEVELSDIAGMLAHRYRELANTSHRNGAR
ncbi:MAG TPA: class II aldolase/adducin family protein [Bryobacteraceae bacterium]|jgi:rhamnose utilization protein RhaD (predicted bifunctional aldolase and dehydrogenase)|nr:class II aldolase/adducin family protein [Bryobacteraceae bacterium]